MTAGPPTTLGDSLRTGVIFLCILTVVQRLIGLVRNVAFCGWLSDDELGRWSLAFGFLMFAAPLAVLGIPGSFGRYVEHFHQRRQLRAFLLPTLSITAVLALFASTAVYLFPSLIGKLLFGSTGHLPMVSGVALGLFIIIGCNALMELLVALRLVRAATIAQFVSSALFFVLGLGILAWTEWREGGVLIAFLVSSLIGSVFGLTALASTWQRLPRAEAPLPRQELWGRLAPFASWIWLANLTGNLFEVADQFLIKHHLGVPPLVADALLGQYYFGRVIPTVIVSVGIMLAGMLLPYLTADWESHRRDIVSQRLNSAMKLLAVGFTLGGAIALALGPFAMTWAFGSKYALGISLLPWLLPTAIWFCLAVMGMKYLACAERNSLSTLAIFLSLSLNVLANLLLLPVWGLMGAALAAGISTAFLLVFSLYLGARLGWQIEGGVWTASLLPLSLTLGPWGALGAVVCFALLSAIGQGTLLSAQERAIAWSELLRHVGPRLRTAVS